MAGATARWRSHTYCYRKGLRSALYRAMRKYGVENFKMEVIDYALLQEELDDKEIAWIKRLESSNPRKGYNCTPGGEGAMHGPQSRALLKGVRVVSEETKQKLSGRIITEELRQKYSEAAKRREAAKSPEERSNRARRAALVLAEKTRGVPRSPYVRAKISAGHKGKVISPQELQRLRTINIGRKQTPEEISRRAEKNRQVWASNPEKRAKQGRLSAERQKDGWPIERRQKLSESQKGRIVSLESRAKMSIAAKARAGRVSAERVA